VIERRHGGGLGPESGAQPRLNAELRVEQFYGDDFSFEIANNDGRGVTVTLDVPAKREG